MAGAEYLQAVAKTDGDVCMIFHNEPDGKELYYLGRCHGPVGTARLFYRLYQVTNEGKWMGLVKKAARAIVEAESQRNRLRASGITSASVAVQRASPNSF